jgi:hypothetical protein
MSHRPGPATGAHPLTALFGENVDYLLGMYVIGDNGLGHRKLPRERGGTKNKNGGVSIPGSFLETDNTRTAFHRF